jgi:hypothetical protein
MYVCFPNMLTNVSKFNINPFNMKLGFIYSFTCVGSTMTTND